MKDQQQRIPPNNNNNSLIPILNSQINNLFFLLISVTVIIFLLIINLTFIQSVDAQTDQQKDFITYITENNLTAVLLSTGLIALFAYGMNKLKGLKKKLDMIEVVTQIQIDQKNENTKFIENVEKKIDKLCNEMTDQKKDTNRKFDQIKDEQYKIKEDMTNQIMSYLFDIKKSIDR